MDRPKAVAVLRQILAIIGDSLCLDCISLDENLLVVENEKTDGFQIRLQCHIDSSSLNAVMLILEQNGLKIKQTSNYTIIYRPH